ncbi:MAG: response regulator transcription factor [Pyrinomonadaceae bacterium]
MDLVSGTYEQVGEVTSMKGIFERNGRFITEEDVKRAAQTRIGALNNNERQIIALLAMGLSDRQIADSLIMSERETREQLRAIFEKLEVSDRFELVLYAHYHSLTRMPH